VIGSPVKKIIEQGLEKTYSMRFHKSIFSIGCYALDGM